MVESESRPRGRLVTEGARPRSSMDRALGFEPRGWGFDPLRGYQDDRIQRAESIRAVRTGPDGSGNLMRPQAVGMKSTSACIRPGKIGRTPDS